MCPCRQKMESRLAARRDLALQEEQEDTNHITVVAGAGEEGAAEGKPINAPFQVNTRSDESNNNVEHLRLIGAPGGVFLRDLRALM